MKQTTKRFLSMILGTVFLIGALVIYFEFIQPAYDEAQKIKSEQLGTKAVIDSESAAVKQVQNLINNYKGQGQIQEVISLSFPLKEDLVGAVAQIYGLANNNDLLLQSISIGKGGTSASSRPLSQTTAQPSLNKAIGTISFAFGLSGSYSDFKNFLSQLETNIRILDLKSLSVSPVIIAGKTTQELYTYNLSVVAYYQAK